MAKTRKPQDAVVANVKRLRQKVRLYKRTTNARLRVLEAAVKALHRRWP